MYYWHWLQNITHRPHTTNYPSLDDPQVAAMTMGRSHWLQSAPGDPMARRSVAIRQIDSGSCNGCESELSLLISPDYDFSRYGFSFTPSPKHADVLVVTGIVTPPMIPVIKEVWDQMTEPKRAIAMGQCAIDGWVFNEAPNHIGQLAHIIPVAMTIEGCPPSPGDMLQGLLDVVDGRNPSRLGGHA